MVTIWIPDLQRYTGPKYLRLVDAIDEAIRDDVLKPGVKLPPQRQLADKLSFTVGTVTRAYALAEQRGLIEARVGAGTFVKQQYKALSQTQTTDLATCQQPFTNQVGALSDILSNLAKDPQKLGTLLGYHADPLPEQQLTFHLWLQQRGIEQNQNDLLFCHGAQQGLFSILNGLLQPGETLLHEANCYPGIKVAAQQLGINCFGVELTDDGLDFDSLTKQVKQHKPKLLYLTLNNQNPTCMQYSDCQRNSILEMADANDFYIIEDDVNYCLPEEWKPPLWNQSRQAIIENKVERVIYLSSLSKLFSGGLRQGYMLVPQPLRAKVKLALQSQCLMVSPLNTEIATRLITSKALMGERETLIRQRQAFCFAMGERLGLTQKWRGLNGWIKLPAPVKAHHLVTALASKGILIRNGDDFDNHDNFIRLSMGGIVNSTDFEHSILEIESTIINLSQSTYSIV